MSWSTDAPERAAELEEAALLLQNATATLAELATLDALVARRRVGWSGLLRRGGPT
jgi:hypothetical protein